MRPTTQLFWGALGAAFLTMAALSPADATPRLYKAFERKKPALKTPKLEVMKQSAEQRCQRAKSPQKCADKTKRYVALLEERRVCRANKRAALEKRGLKDKKVVNMRLASACNRDKDKAIAFLTRR